MDEEDVHEHVEIIPAAKYVQMKSAGGVYYFSPLLQWEWAYNVAHNKYYHTALVLALVVCILSLFFPPPHQSYPVVILLPIFGVFELTRTDGRLFFLCVKEFDFIYITILWSGTMAAECLGVWTSRNLFSPFEVWTFMLRNTAQLFVVPIICWTLDSHIYTSGRAKMLIYFVLFVGFAGMGMQYMVFGALLAGKAEFSPLDICFGERCVLARNAVANAYLTCSVFMLRFVYASFHAPGECAIICTPLRVWPLQSKAVVKRLSFIKSGLSRELSQAPASVAMPSVSSGLKPILFEDSTKSPYTYTSSQVAAESPVAARKSVVYHSDLEEWEREALSAADAQLEMELQRTPKTPTSRRLK